MRLKLTATLDVEEYKRHNVTKFDDILLLNYAPEFRDKVRRELRKITAKNAKNLEQGKEQVKIDVDMDIHYAKRSLDQNAWMWSAHTLEAALINNKKVSTSGTTWNTPDEVTPQMIHDDYLERYAPRATVFVDAGNVDYLRKALSETAGRIVKETWHSDTQKMEFELWKTSHYFNVREFCELAEKIVQQILSYGVDIESGVDFNTLLDDLKTIREKDLTKDKQSDTVSESDVF